MRSIVIAMLMAAGLGLVGTGTLSAAPARRTKPVLSRRADPLVAADLAAPHAARSGLAIVNPPGHAFEVELPQASAAEIGLRFHGGISTVWDTSGRVVAAKSSGRLHNAGYLRIALAELNIAGKEVPELRLIRPRLIPVLHHLPLCFSDRHDRNDGSAHQRHDRCPRSGLRRR